MAGNRSSKILIGVLAGVAIGLFGGLWLGRDIQPTEDYTAAFADLEEQRREDYIVLVSALYALDGDLARAEERLARLNEEETAQLVADLATQYIEGDKGLEVAQDLATLAHALGAGDEVILAYVTTPTHTPTSVPTMTNTPLPTPTSTETPRPTENPTVTPTALPMSTLTPVPPTPTSAPTPTLVPTLWPLRWDGRLDILLRPPVRLEPAAAEPGQAYWRLVVAEWRAFPDESGGVPYIYISTLDETGNPLPGQQVFVDNGGRTIVVTEYKDGNDYGVTFPMYGTLGSYTCHVEGLSDRVVGLGLGEVKGAKEHTAFWLVFQRTVKR